MLAGVFCDPCFFSETLEAFFGVGEVGCFGSSSALNKTVMMVLQPGKLAWRIALIFSSFWSKR